MSTPLRMRASCWPRSLLRDSGWSRRLMIVGQGYRPARKVMTLLHGMLAGAVCIDDCDILRAGSTERVLGHEVLAPSTLGTWLRSMTFGHVRQLDKLTETALTRAWSRTATPSSSTPSTVTTP